ncbi:MAG: hypothetical protein EXS13_09690 [Planctomycetes bacterium]|nr:hypothetical protein [Planctomycetota bacterium]
MSYLTHVRLMAATGALIAASCFAPAERIPARIPTPRPEHTPRASSVSAPRGTASETPAPAFAVKPPVPKVFADGKSYALELRGATLAQAFEMVGTMGRVNLVLQGDFSEPAAGAMPEVTLQSALATLCTTHDCTVTESAGVWIVERSDPDRAQSRTFDLKNVAAQTLEAEVKALLGTDARVVVNPSSNVIFTSGKAERFDEVAAYLARVDRRER